jgi:methylmalonyl-CoA mutase C-terminal domain/subunit
MELLKQKELEDILVVAGGIIPQEDIPSLKACGIAEVFLPGTSTSPIIDYIRSHVRPKAL